MSERWVVLLSKPEQDLEKINKVQSINHQGTIAAFKTRIEQNCTEFTNLTEFDGIFTFWLI